MRCTLFLTLLVVSFSPRATARERRIYKPYVVLSGARSSIDAAEHHRIMNQEDFATLWLRHLGSRVEGAVPVIDFEHCMVVAVCGGRRSSCAGIFPRFIADGLTGGINVDYVARSNTEAKGNETTPFGVFVMERRTARVVLEEVFLRENGSPSKRERRAEFPALKD